ncbi:hypothetical protein [Brevundimonas nasdae]|uniref:hypothetical protein n=1 Tax=Brevundimonas nasdae TaxID=172043 RepID=UPI00289D9AA4|nr:hypothetical protein [Brevundimonas nasdae]
MTHDIIRARTRHPLAHVQIHQIRASRRRWQIRVNPVAAAVVGLVLLACLASWLDSLIGLPVCLALGAVAFIAWCVKYP